MDVFIFTIIYILVQIVLVGVVWHLLKNRWHTHANTAASILTIIGIFGTFGGIYWGLQDFDIVNIERSIPDLLGGLKLAFLTSLAGILSAIILKGRSWVISIQDSDEGTTLDKFVDQLTATLKNVQTSGEMNLLAQMVTLNKTIKDEGIETRGALGSIKDDLAGIHTSLTGGQHETVVQLRGLTTTVSEKHDTLTAAIVEKHEDLIALQREEGIKTRETLANLQGALTEGQGALNTQLEKLAVTFSEKHDSLIKEFHAFSENVAEGIAKLATDELIEALKSVIEDFNAKITEQFGENFKQLNEAVGKTVEWQEQYRQQMDELANEFRIAAESIEKSREAVASIAESSNTIAVRSERIVDCTEKLDPILHTLNDQLDAFSALRERALEAFPLIEERLDELTTGFSSTVQTAIADSQKSVESQRGALAEQTELIERVVGDNTEKFDRLSVRFSESVETTIAQAHASMNQQREALTERFGELESSTAAASREFQETIAGVGSQLDDVFERSKDHMVQLATSFARNLTQRLEDTLNEVTTAFSDTVATAIGDSHRSMESQRTALDNYSTTLQTTINEVTTAFSDTVAAAISDSHRSMESQRTALDNHGTTLQTTINALGGRVNDTMQEVSQTADASQSAIKVQQQAVSRLTDELQLNFNRLETELEASLTKSLNLLGGRLAGLSEKFVEDYSPLTEELHKLVNLAKSNQRDDDFPY